MAEASPPRKTTTYNRFSTMASQNERYNTKEDEFFWLENIMRTAPHKLHSVPGPRTVAFFPVPITSCPDQFPGPQVLPVVCCYNVDAGWGSDANLVGTNHCGMFDHADDDGTFWFTISENTGFGVGPYPPATPSATRWHLLEGQADCSITEITPVAMANSYVSSGFSGQTPQGGTCGKSDEKSYLLLLSGISPNLGPISPTGDFASSGTINIATYFSQSLGASYLFRGPGSIFGLATESPWVKNGDHFYGLYQTSSWALGSWPLPAPSGTYNDQSADLTVAMPGWSATMSNGAGNLSFNDRYIDIHATGNYLYILAKNGNGGLTWTDSPSIGTRIYKLAKSGLSFVDRFDVPGDWAASVNIFALRDDLIFLFYRDGNTPQSWHFGYMKTADQSITEIGTVVTQCTMAGYVGGPPSQHGFYYSKNYFYLSYAGISLGTTNVLKIGPLVCPSNPNIPWEN